MMLEKHRVGIYVIFPPQMTNAFSFSNIYFFVILVKYVVCLYRIENSQIYRKSNDWTKIVTYWMKGVKYYMKNEKD